VNLCKPKVKVIAVGEHSFALEQDTLLENLYSANPSKFSGLKSTLVRGRFCISSPTGELN
jgi:hypothetical protein